MKIVSYILGAILLTSVSYAQKNSGGWSSAAIGATLNNRPIDQLNDRVSRLIDRDFRKLDRRQKRAVRQALRGIIRVFKDIEVVIDYRCRARGSVVVETRNGDYHKTIYDFSDRDDCVKAEVLLKNGSHFCDNSLGKLVNPNGDVVHTFRNKRQCQKAMNRAKNNLNFCDGRRMYSAKGKLIQTYGSHRRCSGSL